MNGGGEARALDNTLLGRKAPQTSLPAIQLQVMSGVGNADYASIMCLCERLQRVSCILYHKASAVFFPALRSGVACGSFGWWDEIVKERRGQKEKATAGRKPAKSGAPPKREPGLTSPTWPAEPIRIRYTALDRLNACGVPVNGPIKTRICLPLVGETGTQLLGKTREEQGLPRRSEQYVPRYQVPTGILPCLFIFYIIVIEIVFFSYAINWHRDDSSNWTSNWIRWIDGNPWLPTPSEGRGF